MTLTTEHGTTTVQELLDLYAKKGLNLSPAFQRRSVWNLTARRLLVESLLDGIPIPTIYLYRRSTSTGAPIYDVIDGKQRLESILLFLGRGPFAQWENSAFAVKKSFADEEAIRPWRWSELEKDVRHKFLTSRLPKIEVEGNLGEIISLFVRINSTGTSLTPQEKRHAHYYITPVLKVSSRVAEKQEDYLVKNKILTLSQISRMKHVEVIMELLLGINAAAHLNRKAKLDEIIRGDGLSNEALTIATNKMQRIFSVVTNLLPDIRETRFHLLADFYSLVILLDNYREEGVTITAHDSKRNALAGTLLRNFASGVDEVAEKVRKGKGVTPAEEPFRAYLMTVLARTDSAQQRGNREKILRSVLESVFEEVDPTRAFNPTQRRILWHGSPTKRCSICAKPILRWEDLSIDHIVPHIRGGKTNLENGAIAHIMCNAAKGAA
jgi:hypothetical protein